MLIATALTLAILWAAGRSLGAIVGHDRDKIMAALHGRSWVAEGRTPARVVTVRFSSPRRAAGPSLPLFGLRAAA
ncbi:MAG TPA: hypothetical protein VFO12_00025 [Sphingomicrobium sp.]|nr:hypothetical protein [Sphingomicrobium sp.]